MRIRDVSRQDLEAAIAAAEVKLKQLTQDKANIDAQIGELQRKASELRDPLWRTGFHIELLKNALVANIGVAQDVVVLRQKILAKARRVARKDIQVGTKEKLEREIVDLKSELQKICGHPFIVAVMGYGGSYSREYDDAHYGLRTCAVCGFHERSQSTGEEIYKAITENGGRVIKSFMQSEKFDIDICQPLGDIIEKFVDKRVFELLGAEDTVSA